jgi:hypothetical protein
LVLLSWQNANGGPDGTAESLNVLGWDMDARTQGLSQSAVILLGFFTVLALWSKSVDFFPLRAAPFYLGSLRTLMLTPMFLPSV